MPMEKLSDEKRHFGADRIMRSINFLVLLSWILGLGLLGFLSMTDTSVFYRDAGIRIGYDRDDALREYAMYLTVALLINCVTGLVFNSIRHRRKNDRYHTSLVVFSLISIAAIVLLYSG
jgi:hypothetical protein